MQRSSGLLLHPTSLPGRYPVGDIGPMAHAWIDWLAAAGVKWWQILPTNPPGFAASPYQSFSAFAGNTMLISPELLLADGLLDDSQLADVPDAPPTPTRVDFGAAEPWKRRVVAAAARRLPRDDRFLAFCERHSAWLEDFALFMALKDHYGGGSFLRWPDPLRLREPAALDTARQEHADEIEQECAAQFIFFDQWSRLQEHASEAGVGIIGDAPIFVAEDSADLWTRPTLFDLDEDRRPRVVAGVPPDYFAETGQLWGNPLYDWERHRAQGYRWWIDRVRWLLEQVDLVRIDHFRGFADYWEIPAGSATAEQGRWVLGPGEELFDALRAALGHLPLIAEDLGEIHDIVEELRLAVGLPGMKIGQFSFDDDPDPPSEWPEDIVGYTGTHDNDTTVGWWASAARSERRTATALSGITGNRPAHELMRAVWASPCAVAVAPVQDLLDLGTEARMNRPGTVGPHNWTFRLGELPDETHQHRVRDLVAASER